MASATIGRIALFSIKPPYAEAILAGSKEVEFRRTSLAGDVSHVVIYATAPIKKVVGIFEVAGVDRARPDALWKAYGPVGGITRDDYACYFHGTDTAYAIKVRSPRALLAPLALGELSPGLRAPQSYQYLRDDALIKVLPYLGTVARHSRSIAWCDETPVSFADVRAFRGACSFSGPSDWHSYRRGGQVRASASA